MFQDLRLRACAVAALALLVAGCAGIPADRGFSHSQALVSAHGGPQVAVPAATPATTDAAVALWLAEPLTLTTAQRIALTRNPQLLEQYARLGLAQADVYEAARISNPLVSFSWLDGSTGGTQAALGLAQNVVDLLYLSPRRRRAEGELTVTEQAVAAALLALAADVEAAYRRYSGALALADMRTRIATAGRLSADLAQRFFAAGNLDRRAVSREQAAATELGIAADRATLAAREARSALHRLMGLTTPEDQWVLAERLALPVAAEDDEASLLALARVGRLDLLAARQAVVLREDTLGITRSYRLLGELDIGAEFEQQTDGSHVVGPRIAFTLPLFNWGGGRIERARADLDQARAAATRLALDVDADVRLALARVNSARNLAERFRIELIPQRDALVERASELQAYMLIGQFELLAAKRDAYFAYQGYLEALTDYWVARAELARAVGASLPSSAAIGGPAAATPSIDATAHSHAGAAPPTAPAPDTGEHHR